MRQEFGVLNFLSTSSSKNVTRFVLLDHSHRESRQLSERFSTNVLNFLTTPLSPKNVTGSSGGTFEVALLDRRLRAKAVGLVAFH